MAELLSEDVIKKAVIEQSLIKDGDETCVEGNKYDFRLGKRILKASFKTPIDTNELSPTEIAGLVVDPNEMVFVLTEERLELPENIKAELSPKRKLSHAGVLILGGFCIDPRYQGKLLFGIYNFTSTPFLLRPGKKLIAAQFYKLSEQELSKNAPTPEPIEDFPDDLIGIMDKYKPTTFGAIEEKLHDLHTELEMLRSELRSKDDWFKDFQEKLENSFELSTKNTISIEQIAKNLKEETEIRVQSGLEFRNELKEIHKSTIQTGAVQSVIVAIIVGFIVGFIVVFFGNYFK